MLTADQTLIHLAPGARFTATNACYVMSESLYLRYREAVSAEIERLYATNAAAAKH